MLCLSASAFEHRVSHMINFSVPHKLVAEYAVNRKAVFNALADIFYALTAHLRVLKDVIEHFYIINHKITSEYSFGKISAVIQLKSND